MRQRTETMLHGLWVYPMAEGTYTLRQLPAAVKRLTKLKATDICQMGEARHVFTHQVWEMKLYAMETDAQDAPEGWRFVTLSEMESLAIPTAVRAAKKVAQDLLSQRI